MHSGAVPRGGVAAAGRPLKLREPLLQGRHVVGRGERGHAAGRRGLEPLEEREHVRHRVGVEWRHLGPPVRPDDDEPLAGLDPKSADAYWKMQQMTEKLSGARLTIAKMYLDGEISRAQALELTQKYLLLSPARAEQSVAFTDHYRSYVINYGWGKDLVRGYIERGNPDQAERWRRMEKILSEPTQPADLLR